MAYSMSESECAGRAAATAPFPGALRNRKRHLIGEAVAVGTELVDGQEVDVVPIPSSSSACWYASRVAPARGASMRTMYR